MNSADALKQPPESRLSGAQMEAINLDARLSRILACAGSGKTEVLARRVVRKMCDGVPPESIVAFTFTEKAAAELKERIELRAAEHDARFAKIPPGTLGVFVGTIHGYGLQMLQRCGGKHELYDPLPDSREWVQLHRFGRRLGLVKLMSGACPGQPVSVRKGGRLFARSLAVVHNQRIARSDLERAVPDFASAVRQYEQLLAGMQLLSFDQMIETACNELAPGGRPSKRCSKGACARFSSTSIRI